LEIHSGSGSESEERLKWGRTSDANTNNALGKWAVRIFTGKRIGRACRETLVKERRLEDTEEQGKLNGHGGEGGEESQNSSKSGPLTFPKSFSESELCRQ